MGAVTTADEYTTAAERQKPHLERAPTKRTVPPKPPRTAPPAPRNPCPAVVYMVFSNLLRCVILCAVAGGVRGRARRSAAHYKTRLWVVWETDKAPTPKRRPKAARSTGATAQGRAAPYASAINHNSRRIPAGGGCPEVRLYGMMVTRMGCPRPRRQQRKPPFVYWRQLNVCRAIIYLIIVTLLCHLLSKMAY